MAQVRALVFQVMQGSGIYMARQWGRGEGMLALVHYRELVLIWRGLWTD